MRISDWSSDVCSSDLVLRGDVGDGVVDLLVADPDAHFTGSGGLQVHQDEAFEDLPLQDLARRQLVLAADVLGQHVVERQVELALQDHVLVDDGDDAVEWLHRSEEHTSELQSLMRISYAVFCLKKKIKHICN